MVRQRQRTRLWRDILTIIHRRLILLCLVCMLAPLAAESANRVAIVSIDQDSTTVRTIKGIRKSIDRFGADVVYLESQLSGDATADAATLKTRACAGMRSMDPFKHDPPTRNRLHAGNGPYQRGLAGAVGADQGDEAARRDHERNAVQRLDAAVTAGNIFNRQHGCFPARREPRDRPRSRRGWSALRRPCLQRGCGRWQARGCDRRCSSPAACRARPARP